MTGREKENAKFDESRAWTARQAERHRGAASTAVGWRDAPRSEPVSRTAAAGIFIGIWERLTESFGPLPATRANGRRDSQGVAMQCNAEWITPIPLYTSSQQGT